jgi:hypothetical protein
MLFASAEPSLIGQHRHDFANYNVSPKQGKAIQKSSQNVWRKRALA